MDQLKLYLGYALKYHFWLLFAVLAITPVVVSNCARSDLSQATELKSVQLQGTFDKTGNLARTPDPPNDTFAATVNQLDEKVRAETEAAWRVLYEPTANLYTWPDFGVPAFRQFVDTSPPNTPFPEPLRELYKTYSIRQLNQGKYSVDQPDGLFGIVDLLREVEEEAPADVPVAEGQPKPAKRMVQRGMVSWDSSDRAWLEERFRFATTPSDKAVRLAQEDYWAYQALLRVIAKTNRDAGATEHHAAVIPRILTLAVGQRALDRTDSVRQAVTVITPTGGNRASPKAGAGVIIPKNDAPDPELDKSRYTDPNGKPIANRAASPIKQFTYLPIVIHVVIDQRRLPEFLTNCTNSLPPIEVLQVGFTTDAKTRSLGGALAANAGNAAAPAPAGGGGGFRGLGALNQMARGGAAPAAAPRMLAEDDQNTRPNDIAAYVIGCLRLVNPPPPLKPQPGAPAQPPVGAPAAAAPAAAPPPATPAPGLAPGVEVPAGEASEAAAAEPAPTAQPLEDPKDTD